MCKESNCTHCSPCAQQCGLSCFSHFVIVIAAWGGWALLATPFYMCRHLSIGDHVAQGHSHSFSGAEPGFENR